MFQALSTVAGRYRIERELGRGSFGTVYAARDVPSGALVALKLLSTFGPGGAERLAREAAVLRGLPPHPHVVRVLDSGTHAGLPFIVMEHVPGGSLAQALDSGRWPSVADAVLLVERLAEALGFLHRRGVVHRDVNASNVLLDASGAPKLADFGLAFDAERVTRITRTGELLGAPDALAPEQLDRKTIGPEADTYALAALLYRLVTRRGLFEGAKTIEEFLARLRGESPVAPDALDPSLPEGLSEAIALGLSKRPEDRPRPIEELARRARAALGPAPPVATLWHAPGGGTTSFGVYAAVSQIGRGGAGVVFLGRAPDGREVAIKVLRRSDSADAAARFEREGRLLRALGEGDGFVSLLDAGMERGCRYLVMPFVGGGTLRERFERGAVPVEETIALGRSLARAIGRAHERGIVHRDLKPENILFTRRGAGIADSGQALVADLGLAKHSDGSAPGASQSVSLTRDGEFHGTAGYMAPEQMVDSASAGPAADVYAIGAILYECLAGAPPFVGGNLLELLSKVTQGTFEPVRRRRPDVPVWLADAVERALARDPSRRFADGRALGRALGAKPPAPSRIPLLVAATVALVAGGALAARASWRPKPPNATKPDLTARGMIERGDANFDKGDWAGAIADYTKAIELDPRCAEAWSDRGAARVSRGDREGGLADCTKAIELYPRYPMAWVNRGMAKGGLGDLEGAVADETTAIELDPKLVLGWLNRGLSKVSLGDHEGAIADYTRALELDPEQPVALSDRGAARENKGDHAGALRDTSRALELDPKLASAWANRAGARASSGDLEGAIADGTRAIELQPDLAPAWGNRGAARASNGDREGAVADYERFLELAPDAPQAPVVKQQLEALRARR